MNSIALAVIMINSAALVLLVTFFYFRFWREYRRFRALITEFVTPQAEGEASPLGLLTDSVASQFSRSIVAQAKATFMAEQSAAVRSQHAVEGDIAEGMAMSSPLLGGILSQFPALKKTLRRNPALVDYAINKLAGKMGGGSAPGNGNQGTQVRFKL